MPSRRPVNETPGLVRIVYKPLDRYRTARAHYVAEEANGLYKTLCGKRFLDPELATGQERSCDKCEEALRTKRIGSSIYVTLRAQCLACAAVLIRVLTVREKLTIATCKCGVPFDEVEIAKVGVGEFRCL